MKVPISSPNLKTQHHERCKEGAGCCSPKGGGTTSGGGQASQGTQRQSQHTGNDGGPKVEDRHKQSFRSDASMMNGGSENVVMALRNASNTTRFFFVFCFLRRCATRSVTCLPFLFCVLSFSFSLCRVCVVVCLDSPLKVRRCLIKLHNEGRTTTKRASLDQKTLVAHVRIIETIWILRPTITKKWQQQQQGKKWLT